MRPVDQTMFKPEVGPGAGNCWQAAVASIFELELDQVPHFADGEKGDSFRRYEEWCRSNGFSVITSKEPLEGAFGLCCGKSPRGDYNHAVVSFGAEIAHDPHPSRDGIVGDPIEYDYYIPLDPSILVSRT